MNNITYGQLPVEMGIFNIKCEEIFFYQYLPIKMAMNSKFQVPKRLMIFRPLIEAVMQDLDSAFLHQNYIYITAKHVYVNEKYWGNRQGYHTDGFMTNDLNYIWCDKNPTIFSKADFNITPDHKKSMIEFEEQTFKASDMVTYPEYSLLKLNQYVVHKVAPPTEKGFRTFVKISVSKEKYNLKGNTHNYLLDYNWEMMDRETERNDTTKRISND